MRSYNFGTYMDKKRRETARQLGLIRQMLEKQGLQAENYIDNEENDPYIFCKNPSKNSSFGGVRIYKIGNELAFRVQKEKKTHPYGSAYPLPIEEMFDDFLGDEKTDELKAGKKVIESVARELRSFFNKSEEAERKEREKDGTGEQFGNVVVKPGVNDYSTQIMSRGS